MNPEIKRDPLRDAHLENAFPEVPSDFDAAIHRASLKIRRDAQLRRRRRLQFMAAAASLIVCAGGTLLLLPRENPDPEYVIACPAETANPDILEVPAITEAPAPTQEPVSEQASVSAAVAAVQLRYINDEDPCYHKDSLCPARIGELEPASMQEIFRRNLSPCVECCGTDDA